MQKMSNGTLHFNFKKSIFGSIFPLVFNSHLFGRCKRQKGFSTGIPLKASKHGLRSGKGSFIPPMSIIRRAVLFLFSFDS